MSISLCVFYFKVVIKYYLINNISLASLLFLRFKFQMDRQETHKLHSDFSYQMKVIHGISRFLQLNYYFNKSTGGDLHTMETEVKHQSRSLCKELGQFFGLMWWLPHELVCKIVTFLVLGLWLLNLPKEEKDKKKNTRESYFEIINYYYYYYLKYIKIPWHFRI